MKIKDYEKLIKDNLAINNGIILKTDGKAEIVVPESKEEWSLEELQHAVGGYIEIHPEKPTNDSLMLCDEEGLIKNKELNLVIFWLYGVKVYGDVIIIRKEMLK